MIRKVNDKINIMTVKKYLFISFKSIFIFENSTLFNSMFSVLNERSSLNENFNNEKILKNLNQELVKQEILNYNKYKLKIIIIISFNGKTNIRCLK